MGLVQKIIPNVQVPLKMTKIGHHEI